MSSTDHSSFPHRLSLLWDVVLGPAVLGLLQPRFGLGDVFLQALLLLRALGVGHVLKKRG